MEIADGILESPHLPNQGSVRSAALKWNLRQGEWNPYLWLLSFNVPYAMNQSPALAAISPTMILISRSNALDVRRIVHPTVGSVNAMSSGTSALCIGVPNWQMTCAAGIMRKPLGKRRRGIAFTTGRPDQKGGPPSSQSPPTISGKALSGNVTEPAVTR